MPVLTREALLSKLNTFLGENPSDDGLSLLEDLTDTYDKIASEDGVAWKRKFEENDAAWKQRYRDRFFNSDVQEPDTSPSVDDKKPLTYEALFKEV